MKNNILYTALAFAVLLFSGCTEEDEPFVGPSLDNVFGPFSVIEDFEISDDNVDFAAGETTHFTAQFSTQVDWEINITGLQSGAHHIMTGLSNDINAALSNWSGNTTHLPMFSAESCAIEANVYSASDSLLYQYFDTIQVVTPPLVEGLILSDFEDGIPACWNPFIQSGADMSYIAADDIQAGQGQKYLDMGGEVSWDWLILYVDIPGACYGSESTFDLSENASDVYFNFFAYVPEQISNELYLFQFMEDDNGDEQWNANSEDMYSYELKNVAPGWQHISLKYSDLESLVNGQPAAPNGNGLREPHKLDNIRVLYLADPSSGYSNGFLDFMIFTEGGPLVP